MTTDWFDQLLQREQEAAESENDAEFYRIKKANQEKRRRASLHPHDPEFLEGPE